MVLRASCFADQQTKILATLFLGNLHPWGKSRRDSQDFWNLGLGRGGGMDCVLCAVILGMHWAIGVHGLVFGCVGFVASSTKLWCFRSRGRQGRQRCQESRVKTSFPGSCKWCAYPKPLSADCSMWRGLTFVESWKSRAKVHLRTTTQVFHNFC